MADDLTDSYFVSVPTDDMALAMAHLPGATLATEPLTAAPPASCRVLSVMIHDEVPSDVLTDVAGLEAVITRSDGHDHLPLQWMAGAGIHGYHLEGYATKSVAQITLAFILGSLHRLPEGQRRLGTGTWSRDGLVGRDLREVTVGVLGVGRIGGAVARQVAALGGSVIGWDIAPDATMEAVPGFRWAASEQDLLRRSDVLTLHVPLTDETRGLIDQAALTELPAGAILVNAARGDIVDPQAVLDALESGHLVGFATDVLPGEPDPPDLRALAQRPDVWLSPHLGAHNHFTLHRRYEIAARITGAVLAGQAGQVAQYRVV